MPVAQKICRLFGSISGLQLNLPKTIVVPLGDASPLAVQNWLRLHGDAWQEVACESWSTYLGMATGPGKGAHSWTKALKSLSERCALWPWSSLGLQFSARAYNVFVFSVLSFVAQLEEPPPEAFESERRALARAAPGPHRWCALADLWNLDSGFGLGFSFRSLTCYAKASQMRVAIWESSAAGGLNLPDKIARVNRAWASTEFLGRRSRWASWYHASHVLVLHRALQALSDLHLSPSSVISVLSGGALRPWTRTIHESTKSSTQRWLYARLMEPPSMWAEERVRYKLQRLMLPGIPRIVASRVLRRLRSLSRLVPPRVHAAVLSTIWNRWCTLRRFQVVSQTRHSCLLGCISGEDSIEHSLRCPVLLEVARRRLNLYLSGSDSWAAFFLASEGSGIDSESTLARLALLVYAVYRTTNAARNCGKLSQETARRAIHEAIYEGARGHARASHFVVHCFS